MSPGTRDALVSLMKALMARLGEPSAVLIRRPVTPTAGRQILDDQSGGWMAEARKTEPADQ